jgi:hypothetical protein
MADLPTWRIYYGDQTTFSDLDGEPSAAPALDVQVIVSRNDEVGRFLICGWSYYWFDDGEWYGGDIFGLFDYLQRPGWKVVRFGRTRPNAVYRAAYAAAFADGEFPAKSGFLDGERRT